MIPNTPITLSALFLITTAVTYLFFFLASGRNKIFQYGGLLWLAAVAVPALYGFFVVTDTVPPRMPLLLAPTLVMMIIAFTTTTGRQFIDSLDMKLLTWMSIVRIPVEISLYGLFTYGLIPEVMTFASRNQDILAGITAPIVAYLYFSRKTLSKQIFLIWNILGLLLLLNIIITAILSVPSPIQQLGFDQPNVGILYFPFVWLASFVAPLVLFSHLIMIRRLSR